MKLSHTLPAVSAGRMDIQAVHASIIILYIVLGNVGYIYSDNLVPDLTGSQALWL